MMTAARIMGPIFALLGLTFARLLVDCLGDIVSIMLVVGKYIKADNSGHNSCCKFTRFVVGHGLGSFKKSIAFRHHSRCSSIPGQALVIAMPSPSSMQRRIYCARRRSSSSVSRDLHEHGSPACDWQLRVWIAEALRRPGYLRLFASRRWTTASYSQFLVSKRKEQFPSMHPSFTDSTNGHRQIPQRTRRSSFAFRRSQPVARHSPQEFAASGNLCNRLPVTPIFCSHPLAHVVIVYLSE